MHDTDVVLRTPEVAGVLERDPGMAGLEERAQHQLPELERLDPLPEDRTALSLLFVLQIALLESGPIALVQVANLGAAEERPVLARLDPLHEQIGHPAGGIHVVGAAALVAGVAAQLEKVADVVVPDLEVCAA